jgi:hypothetical protein
MAQKIIVQDGNVVYQTSDPSFAVNFGINGQLNVTKDLNVGDDPLAAGTITTSPGADLIISPGANLRLEPTGSILLNNVAWPTGPQTTTPGMFLGVSALNTLQFYSFILAFTGSDTLTVPQLNIAYPTIQPGQSVIGPTVVYQCVSSGTWRILGGTISFPLLAPSNIIPYSFIDSPGAGLQYSPSLVGYSRITLTGATHNAADIIPDAIELYGGSASATVSGRTHNPLGGDAIFVGAQIVTSPGPELVSSGGIVQLENGNIGGNTAAGGNYTALNSQFRTNPGTYTLSTDTIAAGGFTLSIQSPTRTDIGPTVVGGLTFSSGDADTVGSVLFSLGQQTGQPQAYSLEFTPLGELIVSGSGSAQITAEPGQAMDINADAGVTLTSTTNTLKFNSTGSLLINTNAGTDGQVLTSAGPGTSIVWGEVAKSPAPALSTSTGRAGEVRYDSAFIYVCVATNTWVRAALTTF